VSCLAQTVSFDFLDLYLLDIFDRTVHTLDFGKCPFLVKSSNKLKRSVTNISRNFVSNSNIYKQKVLTFQYCGLCHNISTSILYLDYIQSYLLFFYKQITFVFHFVFKADRLFKAFIFNSSSITMNDQLFCLLISIFPIILRLLSHIFHLHNIYYMYSWLTSHVFKFIHIKEF
jgi:hypothetical protein